jgi:putative tricarboxylic transport membrane protein
MVLGLVLGSMAESELTRAILLVHSDVSQLLIQAVTRPIALILVILCLLSLGHAIRMQYIAKKAPILPVLEE